ncbi:hypothetical protein GCM10023169_27510 [Georgenia halophila]|uniref:Leucine rich repeat variant domain-containing protein n=2 Tax=Georgenia halophila TaxID=620889 RepID=A0ABP8LFN0_9MICO
MPFTARQAHDPSTPPEVLARIAGDRPDLRALVAGNPATEEPVLEWLRRLGDVGVDAALSGRPPLTRSVDGAHERAPESPVPPCADAPLDWALLMPVAATPAVEEAPQSRRGRALSRAAVSMAATAVVVGVLLIVLLLPDGASPGPKYEPATERNGAPLHRSEDAPFTYGEDRRLDELWEACDGGDPGACVDLYGSAPVDSEYEQFGWTCGGRAAEGLLASDVCSGVL